MSLAEYKKKRNFGNTPEPVTAQTKKKGKHIFVIQRHSATRLHYDFRLEMEGVLKSWAVPKGPSLYPKDKRLAMMVEDHPVDYANFQGIIPEGNYGAGIVEIWDKGTYELSPENDGDGLHAIQKGALKFILHGNKLQGRFALIKMKKGAPNAWMLIKEKDAFASDMPYNSEDDTDASSPINQQLNASGAKKVKAISPQKKPAKTASPKRIEAPALKVESKKKAL
ncbi:3'-phosphoesterase [Ilyomonas limi]|uniref:3'-phosphoesterase n=2 Tax=Ilyomonas limi TaxID=2575867 RepID=A0A4U3L1L7_9BACT|nr:3'-phosphoesterase [Ilyomonas limi]